MADAVAKRLLSSKRRPINCNPTGNPSLVGLPGIEIAGVRVRFASTLQISANYIANGSSFFSPNLNAGKGETGPSIKSNSSNSNATCFSIQDLTCTARP